LKTTVLGVLADVEDEELAEEVAIDHARGSLRQIVLGEPSPLPEAGAQLLSGSGGSSASRSRMEPTVLLVITGAYAPTMKLNMRAAVGTAGSIQIRIRSNFDIKWFQIALTHELAARDARERAVAAAAAGQDMAEAFDAELQATMVVVAAAAFAIDSLYEKVNELLPEADRSRAKGRTGRVVETFKTACELGKRAAKWQESIPELFRLRGELVHFRGEDHESQPHPTGKSHVSMENSVYTLEKASWAIDLALEVLTVVYTSPRAKYEALTTWSKDTAHVPPWLEQLRRGEHP
jgi:hypothetical protein